MRRVHRSLVLRNVFAVPRGSRTQLAEETGLSAMAITRIIRELIDAGLVEEVSKRNRNGSPGRRQVDLRICPSGAYVVGVVISAFGHEVALFDATGGLLDRRKMSFKSIRTANEAVEVASSTILSIIADAGVDAERVLGIGIAIAAFVKTATGTVTKAPYLGWQEVELGQRIRSRTGLPVTVENIADAMNVAEQAKGAAAGREDVFLAHQSVTCGASYTHHGQLVRGANFSAGQIGHLPVGESALVCSCGDNRCFNAHTSGWSVLANLGRIDSQRFETGEIESYARALTQLIGENPAPGTAAGDALYRAGYQFGRTMQNVALIIDPHAIVLAGKLSESPAYVSGCESAWRDAPAKLGYRPPELIIGRVPAIRAAGILALDSFLYSPQLDIEGLTDGAATGGREAAR
ncbi:MAG: ROK family transcriptional regulator [Hyphomicrobiales bacterium]|nr:ROK family transcriptional regulator [Hyphomicrobiales bacterium]MCP5370990.1 ROK family transcriptional regulator [Hyphomicrobiales bacterium]